MAIVIRDSQPEDFETLWRIDQECFPPGISYSRMELRVYMGRRAAFTLVAESEDGHEAEISGVARSGVALSDQDAPKRSTVGFLVAETGRRIGHIITIDVVGPARRLGAGSQLLGAAEDRLRNAGCHAVALETAVDNLSALAFYKRQGYSVVKTWPRYYSNGVDALVLRKPLMGRG